MTRSYADALRRKWSSRQKSASNLLRLGIISREDYNNMINWTDFVFRFTVTFVLTVMIVILVKGISRER